MDRRKKHANRIPKRGLSSSGILTSYRFLIHLIIVSVLWLWTLLAVSKPMEPLLGRATGGSQTFNH
jgi:hypothetical protein